MRNASIRRTGGAKGLTMKTAERQPLFSTAPKLMFYARITRKHHRFMGVQTRRRYTFKTCTIVIATLSTFPAALLPPKANLGPHPPSDVVTYATFKNAMTHIDTACIKSGQGSFGGWLLTDWENQALGLFI